MEPTPNATVLSEDDLWALRESPEVASVEEERDDADYRVTITFKDGRVATYLANV